MVDLNSFWLMSSNARGQKAGRRPGGASRTVLEESVSASSSEQPVIVASTFSRLWGTLGRVSGCSENVVGAGGARLSPVGRRGSLTAGSLIVVAPFCCAGARVTTFGAVAVLNQSAAWLPSRRHSEPHSEADR
jgi:hypothetical protein